MCLGRLRDDAADQGVGNGRDRCGTRRGPARGFELHHVTDDLAENSATFEKAGNEFVKCSIGLWRITLVGHDIHSLRRAVFRNLLTHPWVVSPAW